MRERCCLDSGSLLDLKSSLETLQYLLQVIKSSAALSTSRYTAEHNWTIRSSFKILYPNQVFRMYIRCGIDLS